MHTRELGWWGLIGGLKGHSMSVSPGVTPVTSKDAKKEYWDKRNTDRNKWFQRFGLEAY